MNKLPGFAIWYYDKQVVQMIMNKYNLEAMESIRRFVKSETHAFA